MGEGIFLCFRGGEFFDCFIEMVGGGVNFIFTKKGGFEFCSDLRREVEVFCQELTKIACPNAPPPFN